MCFSLKVFCIHIAIDTRNLLVTTVMQNKYNEWTNIYGFCHWIVNECTCICSHTIIHQLFLRGVWYTCILVTHRIKSN